MHSKQLQVCNLSCMRQSSCWKRPESAVLSCVFLALLSCSVLPPADRDHSAMMLHLPVKQVSSSSAVRASPQQFAVQLLLHPAISSRPCSMHSNAQPKRSRQPTLSSLPRPQAERADVITRSSPTDSTSSSSALPLQQQRPTRFAKCGITGDGSCMFRACVQGHHQLQHGGQQLPAAAEYSKALALRQAVVEELRKNRE